MRGNYRRQCDWCEEPFSPRKTGGTPQRFCAKQCRQDFHTAARQQTVRALARGSISINDLKHC